MAHKNHKKLNILYRFDEYDIDLSLAKKVEHIPGYERVRKDRYYLFKDQGYHPFAFCKDTVKVPEIYRQKIWPWVGILRKDHNGEPKWIKMSELSISTSGWYPLLALQTYELRNTRKNNSTYKELITQMHKLVANAWIQNFDNKPYVNHIDRNKVNYMKSNLEWTTPQENAVGAGPSDMNEIFEKVSNQKWFDNLKFIEQEKEKRIMRELEKKQLGLF